MSSCLFLYLYTETCIIKGSFVSFRIVVLFDLSIYTPRVFEFRTFRLAYIVWLVYYMKFYTKIIHICTAVVDESEM